MSFGKDIIIAAQTELAKRKSRAENLQQQRRSEVLLKVPAIAAAERELAQTGLDVVKAIGMGADARSYLENLAKTNLALQEKIKLLLKSNGYPEDYLETDYVCKKCEDTGYVEGTPCSCRKILLKELALKKLYSNSRAAQCTFESFSLDYYSDQADERFGISAKEQMKNILEYCRCYADDFDCSSPSLYLFGQTGLGKTHLTLAIAGIVTASGYNVIYDSAQNIFNKLEREHFRSSRSDEYDGAEQELLDCDLLIIDDLGSEFTTQFTVAALYNVLNTRLNCDKPVIISTNLDAHALEEKYSPRITSRIMGNYTPLHFLGNDIRQKLNN